ncbi:MAG: hypothetical protein GF331_06550 [Chitinivibrionales bacterium]|nr:hypothetical protein [Chitinivibrionales bacterium]
MAQKTSPCCCTPPYVTGTVTTAGGAVRLVDTRLSPADRRGRLWCRLSNAFRMRYRVAPGLYGTGAPTAESPVFVSANYKMSFDALRAALAGLDAWILVLDTNGINVWCAAGKGTFGTDELVRRIEQTDLGSVVSHRRLVLPQLGAPGVKAHEVKTRSGFRVVYGPVDARDIPGFVAGSYRAAPDTRRVRFSLLHRLALTPMELVPALRHYLLFALGALAFFGLEPDGILFREAWARGRLFLGLGLGAVLAGTVALPLLLPWIPPRSFAVKGWLLGVAVVGLVHRFWPHPLLSDPFTLAAAYIAFPAAASYLALNFTGCTTFTGKSGVKRELQPALWAYIGCASASVILLVLHKLTHWGIP